MFLKGFKTIFQDTEEKMIEIMTKSEKHLVCNVNKNPKKHISLMTIETIILLTNTCQRVLL